jgi:UDP-N-acetylmuramoylalanine--D-glutamate ligase
MRRMERTQQRAAIDTVILGLGATGLSCARFLAKQGRTFAVTDSRLDPPHKQLFLEAFPDLPLSLGRFDEALIAGAQQLIVSPGIPVSEPCIQQALAHGIEVLGDIELFARHIKAPVIAITGSNGKSTVTSLLGEMARLSGKRVKVGGNLGIPALDLLVDGLEPELYVLELSSFQLETTYSLKPQAATVLNVTPDHLDRYPSLVDYAAAKRRIYQGMGVMILNADDPRIMAMAEGNRRMLRFTLASPQRAEFGLRLHQGFPWLAYEETRLMPLSDIKIEGAHNAANALAALALGWAVDLPMEAMLASLRSFTGLPHRCQRVAIAQGVEWYNDSKGTNVGATCAAIQGLGDRGPLILIAGGEAKGADFEPLAQAVSGRVRSVIVIGRDSPLLEQALRDVVPVIHAQGLDEAVIKAAESAQAGDVVLLSPACASFDMFQDYAHRGEVFTRAVREVVAGHAGTRT